MLLSRVNNYSCYYWQIKLYIITYVRTYTLCNHWGRQYVICYGWSAYSSCGRNYMRTYVSKKYRLQYMCSYITAIIFANTEQYWPIYVPFQYKNNPIYTVKENLQCRRVRLYVKTEFMYYSVFTMISALYATEQLLTYIQLNVAIIMVVMAVARLL